MGKMLYGFSVSVASDTVAIGTVSQAVLLGPPEPGSGTSFAIMILAASAGSFSTGLLRGVDRTEPFADVFCFFRGGAAGSMLKRDR